MEPNFSALSYLSPSQQKICEDAQQFLVGTSKQLESRMVSYHWKDYLVVIYDPNISEQIRLACCSAMKSLIYKKAFAENPSLIFEQICKIYINLQNSGQSKVINASQMIIETISNVHFLEKDKWKFCQNLCAQLFTQPIKSINILKILSLLISTMIGQTANNQVIIGEMFTFIQQIISSDFQDPYKVSIMHEVIKIVDQVITLVDEQLEDQDNNAQIFFRNHDPSKKIMQEIIGSSSQNSIITSNRQLDTLKSITLTLFRKIWIYSPDFNMFQSCFLTILNIPKALLDEQIQIVQNCLLILERSLGQSQYQKFFHVHTQQITINLLELLKPQESLLSLIKTDPEYFVTLTEDFCMLQREQVLQAKVCSLISYLCLNVDGYLTFIGTLTIMTIKKWEGSLSQMQNIDDYLQTVESMWPAPFQQKLGTSVYILAAISDQIQKRKDLYNPLKLMLYNMQNKFKIEQCTLPPYIICRFMLLYSFYAYRGCLSVFIPYKNALLVYQHQLQCCYRILQKYSNRSTQLQQYLQQLAPIIIVSTQRLTPLLQNVIFNNPEILKPIQFNVLQKLSIWMREYYEQQNTLPCNKIGNLIARLLDNFNIKEQSANQMADQNTDNTDRVQIEIAVFEYLKPLYKQLQAKAHNPLEQNIIEIAKSHIQKFKKILKNNDQRIQFFFNIAYKVTDRNNCVMNSCLDLFSQLVSLMPHTLVTHLIQVNLQWLLKQQRDQDKWECYYLLEMCVLRISQLNEPLPGINFYILTGQIAEMRSNTIISKALMLLYSIVMTDPINQTSLQQFLSNKPLPTNIAPIQNKPFCIYLINLVRYVEYSPENLCTIFQKILECLKKQKNIKQLIKDYEENLYGCNFQGDETAMNAHIKLTTIPHPLCKKNLDPYIEFKNMWGQFQHKNQFMNNFCPELKAQIVAVLKMETVNQKPRIIYKVKKDFQ